MTRKEAIRRFIFAEFDSVEDIPDYETIPAQIEKEVQQFVNVDDEFLREIWDGGEYATFEFVTETLVMMGDDDKKKLWARIGPTLPE